MLPAADLVVPASLLVVALVALSFLLWEDDWDIVLLRGRRVLRERQTGRRDAQPAVLLPPGLRGASRAVRFQVGAVISLVSGLGLLAVTGQWLVGLVGGGALGVFGQGVVLGFLRGRRRKRMNEQAAEYLRMLHTTMATGETLFRSMQLCTQDVEAPLREELQFINDSVEAGRPHAQTLRLVMAHTDAGDFARLLKVLAQSVEESMATEVTILRLKRLDQIFRTRHALREALSALVAQIKVGQYAVMALIPASVGLNFLVNGERAAKIYAAWQGQLVLLFLLVDLIVIWVVVRKVLGANDFDY